jgi:hypothetical protein
MPNTDSPVSEKRVVKLLAKVSVSEIRATDPLGATSIGNRLSALRADDRVVGIASRSSNNGCWCNVEATEPGAIVSTAHVASPPGFASGRIEHPPSATASTSSDIQPIW